MSSRQNFWTVQNSVVGTAHTNREGREVDFRPAKITGARSWDQEKKGGTITLISTDGEKTELAVPTTGKEVSHDVSSNGFMWQITIEMTGEFQGVSVTAKITIDGDLTEAGKADGIRKQEAWEKLGRLQAFNKEHKTEHLQEIGGWLDARLADPLTGGFKESSLLRASPSNDACATVFWDWLEKFPLPTNQFATAEWLGKELQKKAGNRLGGNAILTEAIEQAIVRRNAERKTAWLAKNPS